ncbi:MAG TPA: hypothetical protein VNM68_15125 [Candidatus Polarisedimenticolia bacterium]|nr:hypothetical protein [Candidatus Polarisedimenticolia bacterium]
MGDLLADWRNLAPVAGLAVLAATGVFYWLRQKPEDAEEIERQRRAYLNRVGRIAEGQVLEIVDHGHAIHPTQLSPKQNGHRGLFGKRRSDVADGSRKLLYYTYAISGVTYETAQDVTGLEERLHLTRIAAGQIASVKYDPSNPSNSILLADDWSGLH